VFSNARRVLSQCNTRLRRIYLKNISFWEKNISFWYSRPIPAFPFGNNYYLFFPSFFWFLFITKFSIKFIKKKHTIQKPEVKCYNTLENCILPLSLPTLLSLVVACYFSDLTCTVSHIKSLKCQIYKTSEMKLISKLPVLQILCMQIRGIIVNNYHQVNLPTFFKSNVCDFCIHFTQISEKIWWLTNITEDVPRTSKHCLRSPK